MLRAATSQSFAPVQRAACRSAAVTPRSHIRNEKGGKTGSLSVRQLLLQEPADCAFKKPPYVFARNSCGVNSAQQRNDPRYAMGQPKVAVTVRMEFPFRPRQKIRRS